MSTRTSRTATALSLSLLLVAAACGGDDKESTETTVADPGRSASTAAAPAGDPIVIGMDEDSTGSGAAYSMIAGQTIRDAIEEVNANGGILGRPVELVVENDESDPTKTPTVVRKLIDQGANALILQSAGGAVVQAKPVVQAAGIIAISPTSITQTIAEPPDADFTYVLANPLSDFVQVYCAGFEAAGIERLAVLADTTPTIEGVNQLLLPGLEECVELVAEEKAPVDASDLNAQVARIKDAEPDAVLVSSGGGNFEVIAHNTLFEQLDSDVVRFSLASIGNQPNSWELAAPGALEGLVYMASIDPTNARTKELEAFLEPKRDDDWRITAYDAQAYDTVQLIKQAIETAGSTDPVAVSAAMNAITDYQPHFGQESFTLSFSPDKHVGTDGLCGLSLVQFGADNTPEGPWESNPACT